MEQILSIIKPDAVKRGLTGEINSLIEKNKMRSWKSVLKTIFTKFSSQKLKSGWNWT